MKKILALVLTLAMMLTMLNVGFVVSAEDEIPAGAIAIDSVEDLASMEADKVYYLAADITIGSPRTYAEVDGVPDASIIEIASEEEDIITIPAGVTLYGNGYTIYSGNYITNPPEGKIHGIDWTHEMFAFSAGNKITLNDLKFGDEALPIYLNARGILSGTADWSVPMFADVASSNVEWNNVVFTVSRNGNLNGIKSLNTSTVMANVYGTHTFNSCELTGEGGISCGSQGGAWFYKSNSGSKITMNDCVTSLAFFWGSYIAGVIHTAAGDVALYNCVNTTPLSGSYSGSGGYVTAFVGNGTKTVYMENCVNYGNLNWSKLTIGGSMIGRSSATSVILKNCVNYGNLKATSTGTNSGNHGFAGIAGHMSATTMLFENCVNYGNIAGTGVTGGIVGRLDGGTNVTVRGCANYGNITQGATNIQQAAGIVGQNNVVATIEECVNYGSVNAGSMCAGILGNTFNTGDATTIKDCVNYGAVYGSTYAGGFVAHSTAGDGQIVTTTIMNSVNRGTITTGHTAGGFIAQVYAGGTINIENCLNAGTVGSHASNEGIGGFIGRVANTNAVITLTDCANIGTIKGSTKNSADYGSFGDTFGQFIGLYTVSAAAFNYTDKTIGGFHDWSAETAVKPVLTNCYAYGTATPASSGKSLTGWITGDGTGAVLPQSSYSASSIAVTEAPNNGAYGINVQIDADSTITYYTDAATAAANLAELGFTVMAGAEGEDKMVLANPELRGYQMSTDGSSIRILGVVASANYNEVGFVYSVTVNGVAKATNVEATCSYVMKAINARGEDGAISAYTAEQLYGKYITAITFNNVPAEGTVVITVTPTAGDYTGAGYTITIVNGVVTSAVAA